MAPHDHLTNIVQPLEDGSSHRLTPTQHSRFSARLFGRSELSLFSIITIGTILYNLLVVAWGVFVRASKSGDGCGSHWPLCDGNSTPFNGPGARLIEASHRASTGIAGLFVVLLLVAAMRWFPGGSQVRRAAAVATAFVIIEGFVGYLLVKFQLVTNNTSGYRASVMSFHVVSTFLLIGSLATAAYLGSGGRKLQFRGQSSVGWALGLGLVFICLLGVSGAISALGHTIYPVKDVVVAASRPGAFWMVRLQPFHPYISLAIGLYLLLLATLLSKLRPSEEVKRSAIWMSAAYAFDLALGLVNIQLLAPIALQMLHLVAADSIIITLVWFACSCLREGVPHVEQDEATVPSPKGMDLVHQYIWLTKPRIISLLLITTFAAAIAGAGGWPGLGLMIWVGIGGYMMAGAANAINMVVEQDLDRAMARTRERPTISHKISTSRALGFALLLATGSFCILTLGANLLAALLALAGLVFYVSIYTLALKRRTWNNIVIGGAAGAFPPLVGWAAVHNQLAPLAWYLFGIVFLWTPVHFWALAILIKDDYAAAGVPMLPVAKGVRVTTHQIAFYAFLTVALTMAPLYARLVGWPYAISAVLLNSILVVLCWRLVQTPERPQARGLFHYSMLYLALLFVAVAVDRAFPSASTRVESTRSVSFGWSPAGTKEESLGTRRADPARAWGIKQAFATREGNDGTTF